MVPVARSAFRFAAFSKRVIGQRCFNTSSFCFEKIENTNDNKYDDGQTHFGFETIREEEKSHKVHEVFQNVAGSYDKMNDVMSFGIHRLWKDIFIQRLAPTHGTRLLDIGGGTGDIGFRFIKYLESTSRGTGQKESHVTISDINKHMLDVGSSRAQQNGILKTAEKIGCSVNWLEADAEQLPLPDNSFSAFTIAFCIRNVTHIPKVLEEAYRVLQPGGRFLCLEFSRVDNDAMRWFYDQYSFQVIPVMGHLVAGQWKPYQYLVESIRQFPTQEEFKEMIESAGFRHVSYENLTFGVVAIHSGFKL